MSTLEETLTELGAYGANPIEPSRLAYQLQSHRELAIRALDQLIDEATAIRQSFSAEDANVWLQKAVSKTRTASYSNSISTYSAEAVAQMASVAAMLEVLQ